MTKNNVVYLSEYFSTGTDNKKDDPPEIRSTEKTAEKRKFARLKYPSELRPLYISDGVPFQITDISVRSFRAIVNQHQARIYPGKLVHGELNLHAALPVNSVGALAIRCVGDLVTFILIDQLSAEVLTSEQKFIVRVDGAIHRIYK